MVKEKPNSIRTYDQDGFRRRAACVCVRDATEKEVLLVTASKKQDRWVVPGGGVEPAEGTEEAAIREALEEAGVRGGLTRSLGIFENQVKKTRTSVYVLIVSEFIDVWEEAQSMGRKRKWFSLIDAENQLSLHKPVQVTYLAALKNHGKVT